MVLGSLPAAPRAGAEATADVGWRYCSAGDDIVEHDGGDKK